MIKNNTNQSEILLQESQREKRKYTKHDYFADLKKEFPSWKLCYDILGRVNIFYQKRDLYNLSGIQDEALECIDNFDSREGRLLAASDKIQKLYAELQDILNQNPQTDAILSNFEKESYFKFMTIGTIPSLMKKFEELFKDKTRQKQRIICIESLLRHEKKQEENEKKEYDKIVKDRQQTKHWFRRIPSAYELSMKRRLGDLSRRIKKDEAEIKEIKLDLERRAKMLFEDGKKYFSKENQEQIKNNCQKYYSQLEKALVSDYKLKRKLEQVLTQFQSVVEQEKARLSQQKVAQKAKEKTPKEKIQDAFYSVLKNNQNLILVGKYRSLGLTNSVVQKINEDEEYKQDIFEHISGLLNTPQGQDFGKAGNARWKPVQGSDGLYELSVNPKKGHCQNMPRLYAKKEIFAQKGTLIELTNNRDNRKTETIWVLVRKGKKGTQSNDIDAAEKVFFENDGKPHKDLLSLNNLGWQKISVVSNPELPVLSVVKNQGRV